MSEWLASLLAGLAASPLLQGLLAALATFLLEDPTTIGSKLMTEDSQFGPEGSAYAVCAFLRSEGEDQWKVRLKQLLHEEIWPDVYESRKLDKKENWQRFRKSVERFLKDHDIPAHKVAKRLNRRRLRLLFWRGG